MCRREATDLEALGPGEEQTQSVYDSRITLHLDDLDTFLCLHGGTGITDTMNLFSSFFTADFAIVSRDELNLICAGNGATPMSDQEWSRLVNNDPVEEDDSHIIQEIHLEPTVTLTRAQIQDILWNQNSTVTVVGFLNEDNWMQAQSEITITHECLNRRLVSIGVEPIDIQTLRRFTDVYLGSSHAGNVWDSIFNPPSPHEEAVVPAQAILNRGYVSSILYSRGSSATVREFFNEEDGDEPVTEVSMTMDSLNARLVSLGGRPVGDAVFREYMSYKRFVLNPEEDDEMGPVHA
jgi:hypothetical protein